MVNSRDNDHPGPSDGLLVSYDRILQKEKTLKASPLLGQFCSIVYFLAQLSLFPNYSPVPHPHFFHTISSYNYYYFLIISSHHLYYFLTPPVLFPHPTRTISSLCFWQTK